MLITRGGHFVAREVAMTKSKAGIKAEQHELKQKWLEESIKAKESGINMDRTRTA